MSSKGTRFLLINKFFRKFYYLVMCLREPQAPLEGFFTTEAQIFM